MTSTMAQKGHVRDIGAVVIGGSAGSLDVLPGLLAPLPESFAQPITVVVHIPKNPPSGLVEALSTRCALPVREPFDKEPLAPGTVFVAPPGYHLLIDQGPCFAFSVDPPESFSRPSIDVLFESAVDVYGARLMGIVLSGGNHDGARGLAAVGKAGGLMLVQEPKEATRPEMPTAALKACPAAEALPILRMTERLVRVVAQARSESA